uniref:NADH-ubiquinone oxidoreductase chain 5 n=1 Tax=Pentaceraster mammillatus TaxID=2731074 RepID=A0A7S8CUH6_9ECHI|nr:NADH dehydrogenase subunit 5 [Pentaceraster mammillatus]QPC56365.1 NADH dehydrogenase subunit 5 [Pentaceraster mammillatus]
MLINPSSIIASLNISIIVILLISIFFFQNQTSPITNSTTTYNFGISHNRNFSATNKNSLFFSSILKTLAILSIIPLIINISINSSDNIISLGNWLPNNSFALEIEFRFDLTFNLFLSVALVVSWSILEFSSYYMGGDPAPENFFRLLIIFLLNMIILTSTENVFLLFIGWEGVGFLSFLLISWWITRSSANSSAIQAIIYNRIGDIGILLFFSLSLSLYNSWSLSSMPLLSTPNTLNNLLMAGALLAAAGKSAQFGLHPWLPAAMEGPTPVSALLHSSTMVVAGIFLLIRLGPLYSNASNFNTWCLILGSLTAIFAATTAISQHDIKKIVAYSTTSQLGLMMVAIGLNQPNIALFHISTHAFFKAMLFLSSGSVIHSLRDEQDIRKMGGLNHLLPNTSACIILGSLALSGTPFLAGFYSKDLILELGLSNLSNFIGILLSLIATLLTAAYSFRIIHFCFSSSPTFTPLVPMNEENPNLTNALNRLAAGTIISGWLISNFIITSPPITISQPVKNLALLLTIIGIIFTISTLQTLSLNISPSNLRPSNNFTTNQWFFENISHINLLLLSFLFSLSTTTRSMDHGWSEDLGAQGIANSSSQTSQKYQLTQTGHIKQYLLLSSATFLLVVTACLLLL